MNYPIGSQHDSRAPWNEQVSIELMFDFEGKVWHDDDLHSVRIKGAWQMCEGEKLVRAFHFSYIGAIPETQPIDADYDVCECIREELGQNVIFNF